VQQFSACRKRLEAPGVNRQSADQQHRYLLGLSKEFQDITNFALNVYYSRNEALTRPPELRLATFAVDRIEQFSDQLETIG